MLSLKTQGRILYFIKLLVVASNPWCSLTCRCFIQISGLLAVCLWLCLFSSHKDTSHIGPVWPHWNLMTSAKTLFSNEVTFTDTGVRTSMSWKVKLKVAWLCLTLRPHGLYSPWDSLGQNTGVGCHALLQGIFAIRGSNPGLLHCRWILYQLNHKGSPICFFFFWGGGHNSTPNRKDEISAQI